ncbi:hypothetical protein BN946_scf184711.g3 [Trametes cinnabarina]|uniref:CxC1-like cysteine cluster associated with KDZ transposases domain-containing protein n=1 Tax=Pycnoporus cinnabarinus TaxID=5643 RepID=A0A060SZK3_PYCCI|nr:hypothetical protein BN946_scf184711.g3 [Trametes cinnabarina]
MARKRKSGSSVSTSINVRYGRGSHWNVRSTTRRLRDPAALQQEAYKKYKERFADYDDREEIARMDVDAEGWEDDTMFFAIPPGEEGVLASHEGGELDLCAQLMADNREKKRYDPRSRRNRTHCRNAEWSLQLPALTDAYLAWRQTGPPTAVPEPAGQSAPDAVPHPDGEAADATTSHVSEDGERVAPDTYSSSASQTWSVLTIKFFATAIRQFTRMTDEERPAVTLARHGFLAIAPVAPTIATSFKVLQAYHHIHGACPRLSIQAFCQALCGIHETLFRRSFSEEFGIAYDVYLDILHSVDTRVNAALARDSPDWRLRNACAPCMYMLEDEDNLPYSFLVAMDGNTSLKLVDDTFRRGEARPDGRTFRTDLFIPAEEVDKYKDEVAQKNRRAAAPAASGAPDPFHAYLPAEVHQQPARADETDPTAATLSSTSLWEDEDGAGHEEALTADDEHDVEPDERVDGQNDAWVDSDVPAEEPSDSQSVCAERWRNAGPEARKKMFALFAATGIFICICRHGHILVVCDMIQSGELMKYPLATVARWREVFGPHVKIKVGYDIACEFQKILKRSSLGPATDVTISCVVPAFHGHSHNRGCQLEWHPMYMDGLAHRMSTAFHRHQGIEDLIAFWGMQKHLASGKFIYHNYRQALETIESGERELAIYARDLKTTPADYERYLEEERAYLRSLKAEPAEVPLKCEYIEALKKLEDAHVKDMVAVDTYKKLDYLIVKEGIDGKRIAAIRREYRLAKTRVDHAEEKAARLEELLNVDQRWLPASAEYKAAVVELGLRKYRRALDNLERLVVQRLLELKKMGMNNIAYKQREKIGKALKARAQAIRTALVVYNRQAAALSPPRQDLTWEEVMAMVSLSEFDLLREARQDIRQQPWAQRTHRDAMALHFKVKRAREEVRRLNVEIPRLFLSLIDEHVDYTKAVEDAQEGRPALSHELAVRLRYRNVVNGHVVRWLLKATRLPGFSGQLQYGRHIGRDKDRLLGIELPPWAVHLEQTASGDGDRERSVRDEDDEEYDGELEDGDGIPGMGGTETSNKFVDFVETLDGGVQLNEDLDETYDL